MSWSLIPLLAFLALCRPCAAGPLDPALAHVMERGWPGVGVLVESGNGPVTIATAGLAKIETNDPITAGTGFHMCSINKTFTAVAILRLIDQHKLSLQTRIVDILPQPVVRRIPYIAEVSVAQLLDHSSGIYPTNNDPAYISTLVGREALTKRVWSPLELVELATRPENKPVARPGEGHHYSDTNYVLLGLIVEQLSHESLKAHLTRTVLAPLEMRDTYFYSDVLTGKHPETANVASGYIQLTKDLTDAVQFNPGFTSPRPQLLNADGAAERTDAAAGLITTLADLHRFASALVSRPACESGVPVVPDGGTEGDGGHEHWNA